MIKKSGLILTLVLLLTLSIFAAGCGSGDTKDTSLSDIQKKGELILGCDDKFPPMGFRDPDGNLVGFDLELAEAVCEKLEVKLNATPIDWSSKEMELESGKIDVIWNGYSISADRNKKVEFTKPYLQNEQTIVVRADSDIQTKEDLAGKILGTQLESAAESVVNEDTQFRESLSDLRGFADFQNAMLDLETSNRLDGVAGDIVLIKYIMQQQPGKFRILENSLSDEYFGIGCPKGAVSLREAIDNALDELNEDGTIEAISNKWFNENIVIRDVPKLTQEELEG